MAKPIFPPFQFPQSNLRIIIDEVINCVQEKGGIKSLMAEFLNRDPDDNGYIMESYFRYIIEENFRLFVNEKLQKFISTGLDFFDI